MLDLILVRHGETNSNRNGTYLGWTDVELNEQGIKQAYTAKDKLAGLEINGIYSSPLKRAKKTAEIINENFNLKITYVDDIKERNFGVWDDLTYREIVEKYPDEHSLWMADNLNYCIDGGESSIQAYRRTIKFIDELINSNNDGTFIIVTHLGSIRKIIAYLLDMGIEGSWRFRVDNCSITRITINDEKYAYLTMLNG